MALAAEPYPGYFTSDPVWSPELCAELYTTLGPENTTHFHPLSGTPVPPDPTPLGFGLGPFGEGPFGGS